MLQKHKIEIKNQYLLGKSTFDLEKLFPYKQSTIKQYLKRYGLLRTQSEAAKLAVKQHKKDKAINALIKSAKTDNRYNPMKTRAKEQHPLWKESGTIVNTHHGKYKKIKLSDNNWMYFHRYIAEKKLGRKLNKNEVVHHIDFDSNNNDPDNLAVLTKYEHIQLHSKAELVMGKLFEMGVITFNGKEYEISVSIPI